jgi:hypothetical protein
MEERPGSGWFGLPAMLAVAVVVAAFTATDSILTVILAVLGVLVLFLAIGLAMTIAKRD